jgi:hypothetical protein
VGRRIQANLAIEAELETTTLADIAAEAARAAA